MNKPSLVEFLEWQYKNGRTSFRSIKMNNFDINAQNESALNAYLFILQHRDILNFSEKQINYLVEHSTFFDSQMSGDFSVLGSYLVAHIHSQTIHKYLNESHYPFLMNCIYREKNIHNKWLLRALSVFEREIMLGLWEAIKEKNVVINYIDNHKHEFDNVYKLSCQIEIVAYKEKDIIRKIINQRDRTKDTFKI